MKLTITKIDRRKLEQAKDVLAECKIISEAGDIHQALSAFVDKFNEKGLWVGVDKTEEEAQAVPPDPPEVFSETPPDFQDHPVQDGSSQDLDGVDWSELFDPAAVNGYGRGLDGQELKAVPPEVFPDLEEKHE